MLGIELPASSQDFGWEGFEMSPKDAENLYAQIERALKPYDFEKWYAVRMFQWKRGRTAPTENQQLVFGPGTKVVQIAPRIPPELQELIEQNPDNHPDRVPGYELLINLSNGHIALNRWAND